MLRKRTRANTSKKPIMADHNSVQSPTEKYGRPSSSSLFGSPRLFTSFTSKSFTDTDSVMSPTSILDSKPFSAFRTPFWSDISQTVKPPNSSETKPHWDKLDSRGIGLVLVDAFIDEKSDSKTSKPESRMVLFGSQLKIQIPPMPPSVLSPAGSPMSPGDFGTKTRNFQMGCFSPGVPSPSSAKKSPFVTVNLNSPRVFTGCLSASEMELSEDYTCVISRGPNPRTTHIFDDCIVESCCGVVGFAESTKGYRFSTPDRSMSYPSESFLSYCYSCKKNLGQGTDIYMYRGEKAFCSSECRFKKIMEEEEMKKLEPDDGYGTCP